MIREPDIGTWRNTPPQRAHDARTVTQAVAAGATLGAQLWFHQDMVRALTNGGKANGWTGGTDDRGRLYLKLTVMSVSTTWVLTGTTKPNPAQPNTLLHEGIWPD